MEINNKLGVIFYCDGTLVDSICGWRELEYELARMAGEELSAEDVERLCTFTIPETAHFYYTKFGIGKSDEDVLSIMDQFMLDFYTHRVKAREGAKAFVHEIRSRGIPCTMASSSPQRYLRACVARVGLADCFQAILSVDDLQTTKRDALIYQHCARIMGTPVETTWGFEDSIYAINTLRNAKFRCVGVFDREDSGTVEQLTTASDLFIMDYSQLDVDDFIEQMYARSLFLQKTSC